MKTIDIGDGQSVPRHHVPETMRHEFDQAAAALSAAQASIRSSVKLFAVQAPASFSGSLSCTAPSQSGMTYNLGEVGGALLVNERDLSTFTNLGFTALPSVQPTSGLRAGIVFYDTAAGSYMKYDGANWAPVTLS